MNITSGKIQTAQKVVIYGPEGIGKSTIASQFPNPLFSDTEGSTKNLDVKRFPKPTSWQMLKQQRDYIKSKGKALCGTWVIDTFDWAEQLCIDEILAAYDKKGIEDFGYGNGYVYEKEEIGRFLNSLEDIIDIGINIVLLAHSHVKKFSQPDEVGEYDRWELKLGKKTSSQISPLVKEWADMVLFANYETFAVQADKDGKKFKAQGGIRVMYTVHHPCWDAKNRHGLPEKLPFDFSSIAHIFNSAPLQAPVTPQPQIVPPINTSDFEILDDEEPVISTVPQPAQQLPLAAEIPQALKDLMTANNVTQKDIQQAVASKGYYPVDTPIANYDVNFINGVLVAAWPQVYGMIQENNKVPF